MAGFPNALWALCLSLGSSKHPAFAKLRAKHKGVPLSGLTRVPGVDFRHTCVTRHAWPAPYDGEMTSTILFSPISMAILHVQSAGDEDTYASRVHCKQSLQT